MDTVTNGKTILTGPIVGSLRHFLRIALPAFEEKDTGTFPPLWLGSPSEVHLESHVELPKGYKPELPRELHLKEDFAEYHAVYSFKGDILTTDRRFLVKLHEVPALQYERYKKFSKAVADDHARYVEMSSGRSPASSYQDAIWTLPYSENPEAARAYDDAREKYQKQDTQGEVASLRHAVEVDPKFTRAWLWMGEIYKYLGQKDQALQAYRKAIEGVPEEAVSYKVLGFSLIEFGKFQEAVPVWQELIKLAPDDISGLQGLARSMMGLKHYAEAASALEAAVKLSPEDVRLHLKLGSAYLLSGDEDRAIAAYQKAISLDPQPLWFNDIAYQLAEANKKLSLALEYALKAVKEEEEASQKVDLRQLQAEDLAPPVSLPAFWDTLGWVYFQMGNLTDAEKYLNAAWSLSLGSVEANHLGQVYERQHKFPEAIHMYKMALSRLSARGSIPSPQNADEARKIQDRIERLSPTFDFHNMASVVDDINGMRTIKLPRLVSGTENAEFMLVFTRDLQASSASIEDVKFISGSQVLKSADKALKKAAFKVPLPDGGQPKLLRRGVLGCYQYSGCSLTLLIPSDVHSVN